MKANMTVPRKVKVTCVGLITSSDLKSRRPGKLRQVHCGWCSVMLPRITRGSNVCGSTRFECEERNRRETERRTEKSNLERPVWRTSRGTRLTE